MDSGAPALAGRRSSSPLVGLWQTTHSSVLRRWPPWRRSESWQTLHCARVTTVRRATTAEPSTEAYFTGLIVDSLPVMLGLPSARPREEGRSMSTVALHVPAASVGRAVLNV